MSAIILLIAILLTLVIIVEYFANQDINSFAQNSFQNINGLAKKNPLDKLKEKLIQAIPDYIKHFLIDKQISRYFNFEQQQNFYLECIFSFLFLLISLLSLNIKLIIISIFTVLYFTYFKLEFLKQNRNEEINLHINQCAQSLKILALDNQLGIITVFKIIDSTLPNKLFWLKKEFALINANINEANIKKELNLWQANNEFLREFLNITLSINENNAGFHLKKQLENYIRNINQKNKIELNHKAENMQLSYLIPSIIMMLIALFPAVISIMDNLKNIHF